MESSESGESSEGGGRHRRVAGLDAVRAVAVLLVLVDHLLQTVAAQIPGSGAWDRPAERLMAFYAVDAFNVLSGFLVVGLLLAALEGRGAAGSLPTAWRGMCRRWARTLPLFWLVAAVSLALGLAAGDFGQGALSTILGKLTFTSNILPGVGVGGPLLSHVLPTSWSLATEEWAYFAIPLVTVAAVRLCGGSVRRGAISGLLLLCGAGLALKLSLALGQNWYGVVRVAILYRVDSIALGGVAAWVARYGRWQPSRASVLLAAAVLALCAAGTVLLPEEPKALPLALWLDAGQLYTVDAALAVVILAAARVRTLPGAAGTVANRLALYSYGLYLIHPLIFWGASGDYNPARALDFGEGPYLLGLVLMAETVGVSALVYHLFEAPVTAALKRRLSTPLLSAARREAAPSPAAATASRDGAALVAVVD